MAIGVLATCLFAALGSLIGAAKILQAIAKDGLLSFIDLFSYARSSDNEPIYAILFTWTLMQVIITFATEIDQLATFVTMFSLLTFGIINLACFLLRITGSVNFRPSFHYFNWKTAAFGFCACFTAMFFVDSAIAAISCLVMGFIFVWIHVAAPPKTLNWGDVMQSLIYHQVRKYLLRLESRQHVKYWRPQILVLVHSPQQNYLLIKVSDF